jgi:predicted nucleic-acid-binding Zn-ribbon protein
MEIQAGQYQTGLEMEQIIKYKCPKCGHNQYTIGEIWAAGSVFLKLMGLENRRFTYISCNLCHFTELYRIPKKKIGEILNFVAR